jgi:hypothetical protein
MSDLVFIAASAFDGILSTMAITANQYQPWIEVDLSKDDNGKTYNISPIGSVDIYKREGYPGQSNNLGLFISSQPFENLPGISDKASLVLYSQNNQDTVKYFEIPDEGSVSTINVGGNTSGPYVRVWKGNTSWLSLPEIKVYGINNIGNNSGSNAGSGITFVGQASPTLRASPPINSFQISVQNVPTNTDIRVEAYLKKNGGAGYGFGLLFGLADGSNPFTGQISGKPANVLKDNPSISEPTNQTKATVGTIQTGGGSSFTINYSVGMEPSNISSLLGSILAPVLPFTLTTAIIDNATNAVLKTYDMILNASQ